MPLTLARALTDLPVLLKAKVVAGLNGLDREIRWTHIVDHPDVIPWVQNGHLLLTTAFSLMFHPEDLPGLIRSLDKKGLAGMVVNIGRYMLEFPAEMIEAANQVDFPLITLPWEVDFVEVTHAIHEQIIREQYALAEQASQIHQILTRVVLDGGKLEALTRRLAEILHCSVTIEDASLKLLAHTTNKPTDEVRERSIATGKTPDEVAIYLRNQGLFDHLREVPKPYHLPPIPEIGLTLERIVSPILVGSQLYGYIWIIASDHPLAELDYLAIERGAVVAALILSREEAIYETEQRVKAQLFENFLDSAFLQSSTGMPEMTWQSGLQNGFTVLVLESDLTQQSGLRPLTVLVEEYMQRKELTSMTVERGRRLVIILGSMDIGASRQVAQDLVETSASQGLHITVGLSTASDQIRKMRQCYQEAVEALSAARALGGARGKLCSYDELGFLNHLAALPDELRSANRYTATIKRLHRYDQEKNTKYLQTLEIYLDNLSNVHQAATDLFIHRNTLYQRLAKISELWKIDFHDPLVTLNLNIAIKDWLLNRDR